MKDKQKYILTGIVIGLVIGILLGIIIQQELMMITIDKVGNMLEGMISSMTINADINETKLVEEINKTIIPELMKENER